MKTKQTYLSNRIIHSFILCVIISLPLAVTSCGSDDDGGDSSCSLAGLNADQQSLVLSLLSGDCGDQSKTWNIESVTSAGETKAWDGFSITLSKSTSGDNTAIQYSATLPTQIQSNTEFQRVWPSTGKITIGAVTNNSVTITRLGANDQADASVSSATISLNEAKDKVTISFTIGAQSGRVLGTPNSAWVFVLVPAS